jgi:hypothetical protein
LTDRTMCSVAGRVLTDRTMCSVAGRVSSSGLVFLYPRFSLLVRNEACQFSKERSQEKTQLQRLDFFLLRSPPV